MKASNNRVEGSQTVVRSLDILRKFSLDRPYWSARELIEATGLSPSTGHRLIKVLVDAGFLSRDPETHSYMAGPAIVNIASSVLSGSDDHELLSAALPYMEELRHSTRETIGIYGRSGMARVALAGLESPQPIRLAVNSQRVRPLFAGAPGKVLMAGLLPTEVNAVIRFALQSGVRLDEEHLRSELAQIRESGFAMSFQESTLEAASCAAPIVGSDGKVLAVMSVSGPSYRWTAEAMAGVEGQLRESVAKTSETLIRKQHGGELLAPLLQDQIENFQ